MKWMRCEICVSSKGVAARVKPSSKNTFIGITGKLTGFIGLNAIKHLPASSVCFSGESDFYKTLEFSFKESV